MKYTIFSILALTFAIKLGYSQSYNLDFKPEKYNIQSLSLNNKDFKVRCFEKIVYVQNPVDTNLQVLNIYIPEEYFEGKSNNGFTSLTAPIFFPNKIGGYMQAKPASLNGNDFGGMPPLNGGVPPIGNGPAGAPPVGVKAGVPKQSAVLFALSKGYIVASAGARGRLTKDNNGKYTGKAPAGIVDLKAAIRYLKYNDKAMPGDANKIISNGTSAGGAMSALVGATGNSPDYEPYLKTLGAANATDDIFAVSAYCPITNLDNADMAYEWQFNGINSFSKSGPMQSATSGSNTLTNEQIKVSDDLKRLFPAYINRLKLKNKNGELLTLDATGNGSFKELIKSYVVASAQKALDGGLEMSKYSFLTITNSKVTKVNFDAYVKYMERQKTPPAFDALNLSTAENQEFGTETIDKQHFTQYSHQSTTVNGKLADQQLVKMLNPMYYIGQPQTNTAKYWRIRHGSKDKDTGLAISVILATYLQNNGFVVNLELPWDKPHSGDYDLDELFAWMDSICK